MMTRDRETVTRNGCRATALRTGLCTLQLTLLLAATVPGTAFGQTGEPQVLPTTKAAAGDQKAAVSRPHRNGTKEPANATTPAMDPDVDVSLVFEAAPGVKIIPDPRIAFVPNIGIIEGSEGVLVVDTGLGEANGKRVLALAKKIAGSRRLYLTTTHFHPEHNFGAYAFRGLATLILNESQLAELQEKGQAYIDLFKTFGEKVASRLEGTTLAQPDLVYSGEMALSLGDREVIMRGIPAHTRGDQLILVPDQRLIFAGDIAETHYFPIMPDVDSSADRWIGVLSELEALDPRVVVPGHGELGGMEILRTLRLHIEFMRDRVVELAAAGRSQQELTDLLVPAITAVYPDWNNQMFLPFEIAIVYAEATGTTPRLPSF